MKSTHLLGRDGGWNATPHVENALTTNSYDLRARFSPKTFPSTHDYVVDRTQTASPTHDQENTYITQGGMVWQ